MLRYRPCHKLSLVRPRPHVTIFLENAVEVPVAKSTVPWVADPAPRLVFGTILHQRRATDPLPAPPSAHFIDASPSGLLWRCVQESAFTVSDDVRANDQLTEFTKRAFCRARHGTNRRRVHGHTCNLGGARWNLNQQSEPNERRNCSISYINGSPNRGRAA